MSDDTFKAMVVHKGDDGAFHRTVEARTIEDLPEGEVLVRVHYSSLNYKDALSATGHRGVTRNYPHTPGIDAAGVVAASQSAAFAPGDEVIVTSYDLGMNTAGGFGQYIRVPAGWIVPLPAGLSLQESMTYGTAGYTAGLAVDALQKHGVAPGDGPVLVSGATGGVGSIAIAILAQEGYDVTAVTGKGARHDFLKRLGAGDILSRQEAIDESGRPLLSGRWAGAVDTIGGAILSTTLKTLRYGGAVASCGNVASAEFECTVYPFILRGIGLLGIDSQNTPMARRRAIWQKLATEWKLPRLNDLARTCPLDELSPEIDRILQGQQVGRVVVDLDGN